MILQESRTLQNASHLLAKMTVRLSKLSQGKSQFVLQLNGQIVELYEGLSEVFDKQPISVEKFSQRFTLNQSYLQQVLFYQYREKIDCLTPERLCNYFKIRSKISRRNNSNGLIGLQEIGKFVQIVRNQIQILAETRQFFVQQMEKVDKIFQEIDFFNNQYIDCASLAQFFRHYSHGQQFSEIGCGLLIKMIKGSEFSNDKFFLQDLMEFIEKKHLMSSSPLQCLLKTNTIKQPSIDEFSEDHVIQNQLGLVEQRMKQNPGRKRLTFIMNGQRLMRKQFSIDRSVQQQYDSKFMDLSMSQSSFLSNNSGQNKSDPLFDIALSKISPHMVAKNINPNEKFPININEIPEFQVVKQNESSQKQEDLIQQKNQDQIKGSQKQAAEKTIKEKFSIFQSQPLHVKFKGIYQQKYQEQVNALEIKQQHPKADVSITKNAFETSLMRSHSRNSAYWAQVKLISTNIPKVLQQHREQTTSKQKHHKHNIDDRGCLSGKISVFERKKIELIYSLEMMSIEFDKWYSSIADLISLNERFNFTNAFNVIDVKQSNRVTFGQFVLFLQQCQIQKTIEKVQVFFNCFSKLKGQNCQQNGSNKENIQYGIYGVSLLRKGEGLSLSYGRVMRFSNFLKMFYLNKTLPLVIKCKQRSAKIQMRWDQKLRQTYCNFFRVIIDAVCSIQKIKQTVKQAYLQMRQVWNELTFEKTFSKKIIRFGEMEKILGRNCSTLLCELSIDDEYIDEQKLLRFLGID